MDFTKDQLKRLANILDNIGQVLLATIVIPQLFGNTKGLNLIVGFAIFMLWWLSLRMERMSS